MQKEIKPSVSLHIFGETLKKKIQQYKGGGIKGVWEAIDPQFKNLEHTGQDRSVTVYTPQAAIKFPKNRNTIKEGAFRKQVQRLDKKPKHEKMSFGIKGNILLMLNVLEILEVRNLSDLMSFSSEKPSLEHYASDTNINVKNALKKLKKIDSTIRLVLEKKPRISTIKICHDWLAILDGFSEMTDSSETDKSDQLNIEKLLYHDKWVDAFIKKQIAPLVKFEIRLCDLLNRYRIYFYSDSLLHNYLEKFIKLNVSNIDQKTYFTLSPLYALYFLFLMNKRFLYSLSNNNRRNGFEKYSFIQDDNITNHRLLEGKKLGEYIFCRISELLNLTKRILEFTTKNISRLNEDICQNFYTLFKNMLLLICSMNLNHIDINQEWLYNNLSEIDSLYELYHRMALGQANIFYPTDDHLSELNDHVQKLEKILDELERDIE